MKKLFLLLPSVLLFISISHAQVADALSLNFINPTSSSSVWLLNKIKIGPNATTESFGLANYDGNSNSTVLPASAWNNLDIYNGSGTLGQDASIYYDLPVLNDINGNPLAVNGTFSGRLQNGINWTSPIDGTDFKDTAYMSSYTVWNGVNMVPIVHLRDLNSYAGTYDLIVYTHSPSTVPADVSAIIAVELDEVKDGIDHNGDGTIGNVDNDGDGQIQILNGDIYGVQALDSKILDYTSGPVLPVVFTNLSANNINISAYNIGSNENSKFNVGGFQIIPTSAPSADPILTISSNEGGSTDLDGSNSYTSGSIATVTATPSEGYEFSGWTGSVTSSDNPLEVTVDSNLSLTANFNALLTVDESAVIAVGWSTIDNALSSEDGETAGGGSNTANSTNPANDASPDSYIANFTGVLGTSVTIDPSNGGGRVVYTQADNISDTTYGSKNFLELVLSNSGVKLDTFNTANSQLDVKVTNNSGSDVTVAGIHLDAKLNFGTQGTQMKVSHLSSSSDLQDTNPSGGVWNSRNLLIADIAATSTGWVNYDVSPAAMTDLVLANGESAAFRISISKLNEADSAALFDNIGISVLPISGQSLLSVGNSSGGSVDNAGSSFITTGNTVTITATADSGYEFISWSGSDSLDNPLTLSVDNASTIIANFQPLFDDNAVVIVGWNSFDETASAVSSESPDTTANGFSGNLGTLVHSDLSDSAASINLQGGGSNSAENANSFDFTYGRAYNISTTDLGSTASGIILNTFAGNNKRFVDFSVTNNSSNDLALSGVHFDVGHLFFQADPNDSGVVLSDNGATVKLIHLQSAASAALPMPSDLQDINPTGTPRAQREIASFDLPDGSMSSFSKSMDFGDLADTSLAPGETAAFRIELENAAGGSNNLYNLGITLDNIAITGTPGGDIYALNISNGSVPGGNVDLSGSSKYVSGQVVNLTATPSVGYIFTGWSGDVTSTEATIAVTMNGDLNVSPQFALATVPALSISAGSGSVTISWEGSSALSLRSAPSLSGTLEVVTGDIQTVGSTNTYTETIEGTQKFYRLEAE